MVERSSSSATNLVALGLESDFSHLPTTVEAGGRSYFLVGSHDEGYQLLSRICPHSGGTVEQVDRRFQCPQHGWCFDLEGRSLNAPGERLSSTPVIVDDGRLFADVTIAEPGPERPAGAADLPADLTIRLHSHACLELEVTGFSLLTDPWLDGPAFLGAWTQYPPPVVKPADLAPNAIWISHEHSDHFHEPTLAHFSRSLPIYVPDFPNRRLPERLAELGFENVHCMPFGERVALNDRIAITTFEPASNWNDAMVLIEIDGFKLLNLNDAGLNPRIADLVAPVDMVASSFSPAASGYPQTWTHLSLAEQIAIMERHCEGNLHMLRKAVSLYQASYLLPFASHFALWHPSQRAYQQNMRTNTIDRVVSTFADTELRVVDLLPGEAFQLATGEVTRLWRRRERLYADGAVQRYVERRYDESLFAQNHPAADDLAATEVAGYFLALNDCPEIVFCENLTVEVAGAPDGPTVWFEVEEGRLRMLEQRPAAPNLVIELPEGILAKIVRDNISWDEAHIGYWCEFSRSPDVYHAGFWRLLHMPYLARSSERPLTAVHDDPISAETAIADIVERFGEPADRVLGRYGLYCAGCHRSPQESIAQGGRAHGLEERQIERLIRELNSAFATTTTRTPA